MRKRLICLLLVAVMLMGIVPVLSLPVKAESNLKTSDALIDVLIAFEGFTGVCIVDSSQRSVGYGTRCDVCDPNMPGYLDSNRKCAAYNEATPITPEHAMALKRSYLDYFESKVNSFADRYGLTFTQQQFDALISFTYNCGEGWMLESYDPEGNFRRAITSGDTGDFLVYAFGLWSKSGNTVSLGHIRRRMIEAQIYLYGVYDSSGWPENLRYAYLDGNGGTTRYYYQTFDATTQCPFRAEFTAVPKDAAGNDLIFAGWFTKPEGGVEIKNLSGAITNGMVLYAHWKNAAGETVTVNTDNATQTDVYVIVPNWWPNTLYEGPGKFYSEVRKTALNEQLHITKTVVGKDGISWGYCADGWIPLNDTNYNEVVNSTVEGTWYQFTASGVQVRTGPGTNYPVTGVQKEPGDQILVVETKEIDEANQAWAKMSDGNWICIRNAEASWAFVMDPQPQKPPPSVATPVTITGITMASLPTVREYPVQGLDIMPELDGAQITIQYSNGSKTIPITRNMVSGFDNSALGTNTITVTCGGQTTTFNVEIVPTTVSAIAIQTKPTKTEYLFENEKLDVTGGVLVVTYEKGLTREVPMTAEMVTGFNNAALGTNTLTVTYSGFTATFDVTIINPVVSFLNYDGTVISQKQYAIGAAVSIPEDPYKPADKMGEYVFTGWDKTVVACAGNATYTATFKLRYAIGDLDRNDTLNEDDGIYLLWHNFFPEEYPIYAWADFDKSGAVDENDGIYLLWHNFFPEEYPLS